MNMKGISLAIILVFFAIVGTASAYETIWDHSGGGCSYYGNTSVEGTGPFYQLWECPDDVYEVYYFGMYFYNDWLPNRNPGQVFKAYMTNYTDGTTVGSESTWAWVTDPPISCEFMTFDDSVPMHAKVFPGVLYNITLEPQLAGNSYNLPTFEAAAAGWGLVNYNATENLSGIIYGNKWLTNISDIVDEDTTSATVQGYLNSTCGYLPTMGFWVGNESGVTEANKWKNVTVSSVTNGTNSEEITGLAEGTYYYVKTWIQNDSLPFLTSFDHHFMTKPSAPSSLTFSASNATNVTLSWSNATVGSGNQSTLIRYSKTSYPTDSDDGTLGYNGTAEFAVIEGLDPLTTYYFSAWTYIRETGSPTLWWYSDLYDTSSGLTGGGAYNVTVLWECNGTAVELGNPLDNHTCTFELADGTALNSTNPYMNPFNVSATSQPEIATFFHNNTIYRTLIVNPTVYNYTFYVPCGDIGTAIGDTTAVTITFLDYTGFLTAENGAYAYIYKYNGSTKEYMHMGFLQADSALRPYLTVGEEYRIGVACSAFTNDDLGPLFINTDTFEVSVFNNASSSNITWWQIANITQGWTSDCAKIWYNFKDLSYTGGLGTYKVNVTVQYATNGTYVYSQNMPIPYLFNYSYTVPNSSVSYKIKTILSYGKGDDNFTTTYYLYYFPCQSSLYNGTEMNETFYDIFGVSPLYFNGSDVGWISIIVLFIFMTVLFTFSPKYAGLGVIGTGVTLAFLRYPLGIITDDVLPAAVIGVIIFLGFAVMLMYKRRGIQ